MSVISQSRVVTPAAIAGGDFQGLMDTGIIIEHAVKRDSADVVLDLLGKCIREPGKLAHVHPHLSIRALGI